MAIRSFHMTTTFEGSKGKFESPMKDKKEKVSRLLNTSLPFLIGVHIFSNPFPQLTAIEEISFYVSVFVLLILLSLRKTTLSFKTPLTTPFILFVLWAIFGLFFALNKPNTIHDIYAHLLKYLMVYFLLVNYFDSFRRFEILRDLIILSTTIFALYLLIYFYVMLNYSFTVKLGYIMPWEIPSNLIGVLTIFALLLALNIYNFKGFKICKLICVIPASILLFTTLATQTRAAILALLVAVVACFINNKKMIAVFLVSFLLIVSLMPVKDRLSPDSLASKLRSDDRGNIWYTFWEIIKDRPVIGIGFGMQTYSDENLLKKYNQLVPSLYRQPVPHKAPHNLIVDITVRMGFVGLAIFFYLIYRVLRMARDIMKYGRNLFVKKWALCLIAALVAWLIQSMFENTASGPAAMVFFIILAMMTILWNLREETENPPEGLIEK